MSRESDLTSEPTQNSDPTSSIRIKTDVTQPESPPQTECTVTIHGGPRRVNSQSTLSTSTLSSDDFTEGATGATFVSDASITETISTAKTNSINRQPVATFFGPLIDPISQTGTLTAGVDSLKAVASSDIFLLNYTLHIRFLFGGSLFNTEKLITLAAKSSTNIVKLRSVQLRPLDNSSQFAISYDVIATIDFDGGYTVRVSVPLLSCVEFSTNVVITDSWLSKKQVWRRHTEIVTVDE